jgi:hypothetical protein
MTEHDYLISNYIERFLLKINDYEFKLPVETKHYAVIVEPRIDGNFYNRILNHLYFLNNSTSDIKWGLQILHGKNNEEYVKYITKDIENVVYTKIDIENFTKIEYNNFVKDVKFWESVVGEKILMFQTDSLLLRNGIDDFLSYDYIGAPWTKPKENSFIGNGGLSLRTKEVMLEISKNHTDNQPDWEDIFFVKHLKKYNTPNIETAMRFSVEDVFYPTPIGLHNPIKLTTQQLSYILEKSLENL